ncbi:MAG: MBL fold metallo-hydrolase [Candidatus Bathyarchaeota archaeon]|nr:MAG: MBL fold metallo-hydrolase [Candidatus Bathyarchaeota archaeon]
MSIETASPKENEVAFKWFNNYSGVTLKTPSKTLVVDPVDVSPKCFAKIDAILITHEHYDHLDGLLVKNLYERTGCRIIADPTSTKKLRNSIAAEDLQEMKAGSETTIEGVTVQAAACNHSPANSPVTYLVTSEEGVKIFHTADSMPFPEMLEIGKKHKPDVAFCTVAIAPGTSPKTGAEIVKLVKPKVAVPYHTASKSDLNSFCEMLSKEAPKVKCQIAEKDKVYIVGKQRKK